MAVQDFPQYVAFKGDNGKYLGYYLDEEYRGFLKFAYDDLSNPYVKHELVINPTDERYIHIKCCYNNKFWRRHATNHWWIFAGAESFNTDQSSWSCTLFDPKFDEGSKQVSLRHLQLNKFSARWRLGAKEKLDSCLYAGEDVKPDEYGVMTYYDLDSLTTLPKYVAFKGDNGKYLGYYLDEEYRGFLKFAYDDLSNPYVKHELVINPTDQRYVHIKCCYNNKFWRRHATNHWWIFAGAESFNTDQSSWSCTLFDPKFDEKQMSLRHLQLNKFSARWRLGAKEKLDSCLFAGEDVKPDECGVMTYYVLDSLPKYVAFKGDNGKYLGYYLDDLYRGFLKFAYDDLSSPYVKHELLIDPTDERYVHIKCCYNNKFWRRHATNHWWIFAGAESFNTDQSSWSCTLFEPKFDKGFKQVSLRHVQLNKFSARWRLGAEEKLDSCLFAGEDVKPDECGVMTYYDLDSPTTLPKYVAFKGDNGKYLETK